MYQLLPASILALSLSQADLRPEPADPIGPLAQAVYPADDDDRPELFLNNEGDSDPANYQVEDGDSDADNFESPDPDELARPFPSVERSLV